MRGMAGGRQCMRRQLSVTSHIEGAETLPPVPAVPARDLRRGKMSTETHFVRNWTPAG